MQSHEEVNRLALERYHKNKTKNNLLENMKTYHKRKKMRLFKILGGAICVRCGFTDDRALQFDHKKGMGQIDRKMNGITTRYKYYIDHPDEAKEDLQVLCANCNWIKRFENNENSKGHN